MDALFLGPGLQAVEVAVHVSGHRVGGHARPGQRVDTLGRADVAAVHDGLGPAPDKQLHRLPQPICLTVRIGDNADLHRAFLPDIFYTIWRARTSIP